MVIESTINQNNGYAIGETDDVPKLKKMATRMRKMALDLALSAGPKGSHIGDGFSSMEIMAVHIAERIKKEIKTIE